MTFLPRSLAVLLVLSLLAGPVLSGSLDQPLARSAPDEILVTCQRAWTSCAVARPSALPN